MGDGREGSERLLALLRHQQRVAESDDPRAVAERVAEAAHSALGMDAVGVFLVTWSGRDLELTAHRGDYPHGQPGDRLPLDGDAPAARAVRAGEPLREPEVGAEPRRVLVPVVAAGTPVGLIDAVRPQRGIAALDELLLRSLAGPAAVALGALKVRDELAGEKSRLEAIFQCSADAVITTDPKGTISAFSPGAEELFGFAAKDVVGRPVTDYYLGGEVEARRVQRYLEEEGKVRNYEAWFRTASGEPVPTSLSASVLRDRSGHVLGTLGILKDITSEKRLERKLSYTIEMLQEANENLGRLAVTDGLSGLKNQRFFHRKLEEELLRAQRTGRPLSLLMIDIDKFKRFNDAHGHQVGDRVIQVMGATILQSIRKIDHGCRYGGEEFTVVLPETSPESGTVVARRIQDFFRGSPAWAELGLAPPTVSIGLAAFQEKSRDQPDTDALVKQADDAMYRVKRRGGDGIEVD
jgi:diguanylate cyclase (GGDEF)-like protein/PAS domain S-box-containing protein